LAYVTYLEQISVLLFHLIHRSSGWTCLISLYDGIYVDKHLNATQKFT